MPNFIHVLYIQEEDGWFAQCLDFNVAAQGDSLRDAEGAFFRTWAAQIAMDRNHGREPFAGLGKAPDQYWEMLKGVESWRRGEIPISSAGQTDVPPAYVIAAQVERLAARQSGSFKAGC